MAKVIETQRRHIELDIVVTSTDVCDIVCAALEGGITYWCMQAEAINEKDEKIYFGKYASDQLAYEGGVLRLHDCEEDKTYDLTLEKLLKGIELYIKKPHYYEITEMNDCGELVLDTMKVDAEVADMIVQYALFDEVIYG